MALTAARRRARAPHEVVRFGQYSPHSGPAVPLFVAGDAEPPAPLATGSLFAPDALAPLFDEPLGVAASGAADGGSGGPSLFWAAALVGGWARPYFRVAQPIVEAWRDELEVSARVRERRRQRVPFLHHGT